MEEFERPDSPVKVIYGMLPTAADPAPSNIVRREYANGTALIEIPKPTPEVLQEYVQALAQSPDSAELHLAYGNALCHAEDKAAALTQIREAVRLAPNSRDCRSAFAMILDASGDAAAAVTEFYEALRLQTAEERNEQGEAILRWGLAETYWKMENREAARREIAQAVALEEEAVSKQHGSPQMLQQLREKQAEFVAR